MPCAVAPPIRLTGGRVLDRCVKHTEEPTHLSEDTLLCLRPSHSAVMPSVLNVPPSYSSAPQSWFVFKLREKHERISGVQYSPLSHFCLQILQLNATYLSEKSALHSGNILASSTAPCGPSQIGRAHV